MKNQSASTAEIKAESNDENFTKLDDNNSDDTELEDDNEDDNTSEPGGDYSESENDSTDSEDGKEVENDGFKFNATKIKSNELDLMITKQSDVGQIEEGDNFVIKIDKYWPCLMV